MIPRLYGNTLMYSKDLINTHFWLATVGTVIYIVAMWISGITQGLMWSAVNADGTLTYSFVDSLQASKPFYLMRAIGGAFFLSGMFIMLYNVIMTIRAPAGSLVEKDA